MKSLFLFLLLILCSAIGFVAWITPGDGSYALTSEQVSPPDSASSSPASEGQELSDPERAESQVAQGESGSAPSALDEAAAGTSNKSGVSLAERRWAAHQLELDQLYGQLDREQLRAELVTIDQAIADQTETLFEQRFDLGVYQIQFIGADPVLAPELGPRGRMPLQESRTVTDPESFATQINIASLPVDEFPAFYELIDEGDWLRGRVGE